MGDLVNPYIAGAPVTEQRMFFGREDIFQWIENSITGQYADHILVVHGQRRVGKTSVLKQLGNRLPQHYIPVFFDLQGRTHTTLDRFLWWLAREIVRVLKQDHEIDLPIPDKEEFSRDVEFFETRFLPDLNPVLADKTLLLTFDEFDNLEESEVKEELARPLVDYLRRMMGRANLNFIFSIGSSGRKLENMQAAYTEFFKAALYKKISFLNEEQTHHLITRPVEGVLTYDRKAVERIYSLASGHPYFTQLTCHELFARCQRTDQREISREDVEAVLDDVVERGTVNLKFVWDEASDIEKWALATLAQMDRSDLHALTDTLRNNRVRFTDSDLTSGLLHLREKDILSSDNRFVIQLLSRWLQKNRPIEQVREELTEVNPIANRYIEIGLEFKDARLFDKAIESFQEALAIANDNIQAQVNIALTYMDQKLHDKAVVEFEKALALDDEDVSARAGLCEAHLALGDSALTKGREKDAALSYQRVLAINAEHTEARGRMAEIARKRAEKALTDGRDEEAFSAFAEALKYTPEDEALSTRFEEVKEERREKVLSTLLARAEKELTAKNWDSAIRILQEGLQLSKEDERFKERIATAIENQRAAKLESYLARASQAEQAGKWEAAVAALQEYLSIDADQTQVRERLERARGKLREIELRELRERARSFARSERWEESLAAWDAVLLQEPADPSARSEREAVEKSRGIAQSYSEAQSAFAKRNYDKAIALFKSIVMEDADYKEATRLLAESVELRRAARKWWQSRWALGTVGVAVLLVVAWGVFRFGLPLFTISPTAAPTEKVVSVGEPATATAFIPPTASPTPLPFKWTRLSSGQFLPRATVTSIVFDPSDPGVIYVGTEGAGIYKSIDGGLSWQPSQNGLSRSEISSLIIDPEEPDILYAGLVLGGVYKTTDGGQTWQAANEGIDIPGGAFLATVAMDPADRVHLYFTDSLSLYETKDGGASWAKLSLPSCPKLITSMVIPAGAENTIYLADRERSDECDLGIHRSNDGGETWGFVPFLTGYGLQLPYSSMAVSAVPGESIFLTGSNEGGEKLYRTTDGGGTWETVLDHKCYALWIDPGQSEKIYCGGPDQLLASADLGKTWETVLRNTQIRAFVASITGTLFAGGEQRGLFVSTDGGASWSETNSGLGGTSTSLIINPLTAANLYVVGSNRLYRSINSGETWEVLTDEGSGLAFDKNRRTMYLLAETIMVSEDDGETWQATSATNQRISSFVAHPLQSRMLIAVHESGFSLSNDGGLSWDESHNTDWAAETDKVFGLIQTRVFPDSTGGQFYIVINGETTGALLRLNGITGDWGVCSLPKDLTTINLLVIDPRDSEKLIISSPGNGLLVSADGCRSWEASNNGLGSLFVNSIALDPANPDLIYVGTDGGALQSSDGGQNWGQINDGLLGATVVYSIVVDKDSNVYAATPYGIFKLEGK